MDKLVIGIIICFAVGVWKHFSERPGHPRSPASSQQSVSGAHGATASKAAVEIYTTSYCGYCKQAKEYMQEKNIAYNEHDVEHDPVQQREFEKLGGRGVPLIIVGEQVMHGFNEREFARLVE